MQKEFVIKAIRTHNSAGTPVPAGLPESTGSHKPSARFIPPDSYKPVRKGQLGTHLDGAWFRLPFREKTAIRKNNPVSSLDLTLFHEKLLKPLLGISDQTKDSLIDFVGGQDSTAKLRSSLLIHQF